MYWVFCFFFCVWYWRGCYSKTRTCRARDAQLYPARNPRGEKILARSNIQEGDSILAVRTLHVLFYFPLDSGNLLNIPIGGTEGEGTQGGGIWIWMRPSKLEEEEQILFSIWNHSEFPKIHFFLSFAAAFFVSLCLWVIGIVVCEAWIDCFVALFDRIVWVFVIFF